MGQNTLPDKVYKRDIHGTPERKKRIAISNDVDEVNEWGKRVHFTKEQLHEMMWDKLYNLRMFRIPREVMERIDLTSNDKIVYAFLKSFPCGVKMKKTSIGGVCGLSTYAVASSLYNLEHAGLMERKTFFDKRKRFSYPSYYRAITPPKRFSGKKIPRFVNTKIDNIEKVIRNHFYAIEA